MFDRAPMLGQVKVKWNMGQAGSPSGGQGQATGGGGMTGGPSVSVSHAFSGTGAPLSFNNFQDFGWWPQYYNYPIYTPPPPPAPSRMICRKLEKESEQEGKDVFECESEAPKYTYPTYSAYPVTYVRSYRRFGY